MKNLYHVIVGADQGDLFFTNNSVLAHAIIEEDGRYVFAEEGLTGTTVMHYQRYNDFIPLKPKDRVLARKLFVDFDNMHDKELDARYHAYKLIQKSMGRDMFRIDAVDNDAKTVDWYISIRASEPLNKVLPWSNPEQLFVSTTDYSEVDGLCNVHRISVVCNQDIGEELYWKAESPYFRGMTMYAKTRSRAVVQLVLWAFYQRNVHGYVSQGKIDEILNSHSSILVVQHVV